MRAILLGTIGLFVLACGEEGGSGGSGGSGGAGAADPCKGGVVVDGVCEGKCKPELCVEGNTCVANRCVLLCDSYRDCASDGSQSCLPAVEDDTSLAVFTCQPSGRPTGVGVPCPNGTECPTDLECETAGEGDADAYCVDRDCASDADCTAGYFCAIARDPHEVCGSSPKKGDNDLCGTTEEPCVTVDANGVATDGSSRFEGSVCMLRRSCFKRAQLAPCATDLDCSVVEGQKCTAYAGESRCSRICGSDTDCRPDAMCDTAQGACVPRFSAWLTSGAAFCEPCLSDEDCGPKGTTWSCVQLSGGEGACFDQSFPDTCTTDADCPLTPGRINGTCLTEAYGVAPGDPIYHRCYLPIRFLDNKTSCW